jgi:hypothetical protein
MEVLFGKHKNRLIEGILFLLRAPITKSILGKISCYPHKIKNKKKSAVIKLGLQASSCS